MSASRWLGLAAEEDRADVARAAASLGAASVEFFHDADALRHAVLEAMPEECAVIVGPVEDGVSDVNLAAAIACDGRALSVALARRGVSGSLRSRAARAGIDDVVDFGELQAESLWERGATRDDGGRPGGASTVPSAGRGGGHDSAVGAPASSERAPVVTFCSGRGGSGKTALVAMAAATAASWDMRVVALDLDLSCGNLYSCFGLPHGIDLGQPGAAPALLAKSMSSAAPGVRLLGPCERPEMAELAMPLVGELIDLLAKRADLVLVDTSTTFTDAVAQAVQMSDRLVLVSDGRPGAASALARVGGLAVRLGVARTRIARLDNRANPRSKMDLSLARAEMGLEAARVFRVFEGGEEVSDFLAAGQVTELVDSGSPFAESVSTSLAQILAELGRLPDCEEAQRAARESTGRRRGIFGTRREARRA